jgi:hypothetical protein
MHLDSKTALDMADGTKNRLDNPSLDRHLAACNACSAEVQHWSTLVAWVRRAHLASAPAGVVPSAKSIFRDARRPARQVAATLIHDSLLQASAASLRAEARAFEHALSRQLVFQAEEFDIYVRISSSEDRHDLLGQILQRGRQGFVQTATLYLRHDDERIASAAVNDLGEFEFHNVPEGTLSLQIDLPNITIISAIHTAT